MSDGDQSKQFPAWAPHELSNYDDTLCAQSATEFQRLASASSQERYSFIINPREAHKRLYGSLTPNEHPEYAGTYRGTPGTSLEARRIFAVREDSGLPQEFISPDKVMKWLQVMEQLAKKFFDLRMDMTAEKALIEVVRLFQVFGMIHPFLDGNGHIQRLIFAACIMERANLQLRHTWTIHPRPYDVEIKMAFEIADQNVRLTALRNILSAYVSVD